MRLQDIILWGGFIVCLLLAAMVSSADLTYNLRAELEDQYIYIDNEKHYYDIFFISTPSYATVTIDNYAADLGSSNENYDYNDPYLYLLPSFQQSINNYIYEDDDGNEDVEEGLFFYLADITFTNNMIALVTSYDPEVKGTVDFNIISDNQLMIIPEPAAISLLFTAGILLIVLRKNKRLV